ncbi:beta-1,3-glucan-binding protein-like isoform X2 [Photinus pyralis]|uniref:beta-1,3-glucan-binding protein-like isoform X2 n=2 Tax=Photinus pyralis TaxID=7054 RepID=UPI001266F270|nr:beta-1,3-glucan-binding protein-like isoform X2 [Photinus pyralis]
MRVNRILSRILCIVFLIYVVKGSYVIPPLKLEALKKGGFRVYFPDVPDTTLFAFHANINDDILTQLPGNINGETRTPTNGFWILEFNNKLKQGDEVNYWMNVNANRRVYRKDSIKIIRLLDEYTELRNRCDPASTVINADKSTCLYNVIFQDKFEGTALNTMLWKVEHKIPTYSEPNSPFNSYENREDTRFIKDNKLHLKPNAVAEAEVRGTLNLRDGCTGTKETECFYEQRSSFLLPPVKSAKIVSKTSFKYGKVEIRAQLPRGDWIFPIIQLESAQKDIANPSKIWIAYSRGNTKLIMSDPNDIDVRKFSDNDIGGRLLLSGPVAEVEEPERSRRLVHKYANQPFFDDYHIYGLLWTKNEMRFYIDSEEYGSVDLKSLTENFDRECVLSLGVGVGGLFDFPEGVSSNKKPWKNEDRHAIKRFFEGKPTWLQTWDDEKSCLIVDYVQVTAV